MKEILEWDDRPREMWVWNKEDASDKVVKKVVHILDSITYPILTVDEKNRYYENYKHCAEIEISKIRRTTNQELAWWLQDGINKGKHREFKHEGCLVVHDSRDYLESERNSPVPDDILVRENGGEWCVPLFVGLEE